MKTVRMRMFERVQTRDAARPMGDAMLTCPTDAEWREYCASVAKGVELGRVYNGVEASLDALDPKSRKMLLDRIAVYGEMRANDDDPDMDTGELADGGKKARGALDGGTTDFDPFGRHESARLGQELNSRNAEAWGQRHVPGRGRIAK
jgi:hypothetical protein